MSSRIPTSLLDLKTHSKAEVENIFSIADSFLSAQNSTMKFSGQTAALLFFEASTRTRMSFETACVRAGLYPLRFDGKSGTSLEKGETLLDTVLNVAAMKPSLLVIRCSEDLDLRNLSTQIRIPILNAGWGKMGHPTQALLDAYTIRQNFAKNVTGKKLLIVGDIRHSRVASSHFELSKILGYEVGICGPEEFRPEKYDGRIFQNLKAGVEWADVVMALRVQNERHQEKKSSTHYSQQFGLTTQSVQWLKSDGLILHPGPINQGVELDAEVLSDPRSKILDQVSNGVVIRQALIHQTLLGGAL